VVNAAGGNASDIGAYEAHTFEVNSTADADDGLCRAPGTGNGCTLREAINAANAELGAELIAFAPALTSGGPATVTLLTALADLSSDMTIAGPGADLLNVQRSSAGGTAAFRIFRVNSGANVIILGMTITNGLTADGTSPIFIGAPGGGILNLGTLTLTNDTIHGNQTGNGLVSGGSGAGIYNAGTLTLSNSTISGNQTGTGGNGGSGGGILNDGTLTIVNTTVSGNQTSSGGNPPSGGDGGFGGGIYNANAGALTLINATVNGNTTGNGGSASSGGNGGGIYNLGTTNIKNTIVANNIIGTGGAGPDLSGTFNSQDYNLVKNTTGSNFTGTTAHDITGQDPNLGSLANNGGPTQTHALLAGSPALDAGDNCVFDNTCSPVYGFSLTTDQRGTGFSRKVDGPDTNTTDTGDIGAFEAQVSVADIADQTINEDGSLSLPFNVGGAASITSVTATSSNTTLVPNNPANILISGSGSNRTLLIIPVANAFGTSTITVTVNGSNGQTMTDTFLLTVNPVNDAPAFTKGLDQAVNENDGAQTVNNWATNISAGPPDESGQSLTFIVANNSNPALFAVAPAISSSGALTFTPATGVSGVATITIALMDNGGMANGGIDTSATQSFSINVREGGTLAFSSTTYNVAEDAGVKVITINRTFGSAGTATVLFQTSDGTATAADYTSVSQTITFNDGEVSKTVNVAITDDLFKEPDETVNLTLSNAGGSGQLGAQTTALLTIVDDDPVGGYIRFSDANFDTTESSGSTDITVERLGTTTEAVTVNYATADDSGTGTVVPCATVNSIASSRCDFTTALGALRFAAGESSKTFVVLVSQDNYVEGPETLTLTLSNLTGGAALGTPSTATLTIADDATEPATNPIDVADSFVRQHYHDFLNREPDAAGLAFWSNQITECQQPGATCNAEVRRINVSAAFFLSIEFQETGFLVYRMYKAAYGNLLGAPVSLRLNEFLPDTQQIGKDIIVGQTGWEQVLENNKVAFALDFVSRSRFTTAYPTTMTPAQFVDALYLNTGVTPSAAELTSVIGEFWSATNTADLAARGRAVRRVAENSSFTQQEFNRAFVLMQYFGYLRRNPNDAPEPGLNFDGYNFWLNKLNQFGGNFINAEMVKAFIVSGEYRQRFGP
jgi:CSLREA domain-containing protein